MILSGLEIKKRLNKDILISPFKEEHLNPNSYNLTLAPELQKYRSYTLDTRKSNETYCFPIPEEGCLLRKDTLYLGRTNEYTVTNNLVPILCGRSSLGRLGIAVHVTAGFGDVGFAGYWTLEITAVQDIMIYPNIQICQIMYHTIEGEYIPYHGRYQNNSGIGRSRMEEEFNR